jgi:hypothetical protein
MKRTTLVFNAPCLALWLALCLAQGARAQAGQDPGGEAARYVATHEPLLSKAEYPGVRLHHLQHLAAAAFAAGDKAKAAAFARDLMALGEQLKKSPGFGPGLYTDATHVGNLVLGHLALEEGDVGAAKEHLLAAGRVPGSPVLVSFGPHFLLAKQLLERGERETVVEYFDLCAKFWQLEDGRLGRWKEAVRRGETPDFKFARYRELTGWRHMK